MANLAKLKLTTATRKVEEKTVEEHMRERMLANLDEQLALAKAMIAGTAFAVKQTRYKTDENGERVAFEKNKRLRQWFWHDVTGTWFLELRYGNRSMVLNGDKTAIEVGGKDQLVGVLETLIAAVKAGELDKAMAAAKKDRMAMLRKG